jgi:hypothetical protein
MSNDIERSQFLVPSEVFQITKHSAAGALHEVKLIAARR